MDDRGLEGRGPVEAGAASGADSSGGRQDRSTESAASEVAVTSIEDGGVERAEGWASSGALEAEDGVDEMLASAEPSVDEELTELGMALAEVVELRQRVEARDGEIAALRAEVVEARQARELEVARLSAETTARQAQETEIAGLRAQLAEVQRAHVEAYRRTLLAEHPGEIVEEMLTGSTIEELEASALLAQTTYARALEAARRELSTSLVPIGASPRVAPTAEEMSPIAKITAALGRHR
jgi:hypothetical protein